MDHVISSREMRGEKLLAFLLQLLAFLLPTLKEEEEGRKKWNKKARTSRSLSLSLDITSFTLDHLGLYWIMIDIESLILTISILSL